MDLDSDHMRCKFFPFFASFLDSPSILFDCGASSSTLSHLVV
jgi:hypothetical protein